MTVSTLNGLKDSKMDISEVPMCEDHPSVAAEVICIKHKEFVCIDCAVKDKKHASKKCDSKPIKNLTAENDLKLVTLLAMKVGILQKKTQLEAHMADTDVKKIELKAKIEKFQTEIITEIQTKVDLAIKSADGKANTVQEHNKKRLDQIDRVNAMFEAEIDRLTTKKSKQSLEFSLSDLRKNAHNLPGTDLRITREFTPDQRIKDVLMQSKSIGHVILVEDDELYDEFVEPLAEQDDGYLEPIKKVQPVNQESYDSLQKSDSVGTAYRDLDIKADIKGSPYKKLSVTEGMEASSKPLAKRNQPLPEPPAEQYENTKLNNPPKTIEDAVVKRKSSQNDYTDYEQVLQSNNKNSTTPGNKQAAKKTSEVRPTSGTTPTPIAKTSTTAKPASVASAVPLARKTGSQSAQPAEPLRRGSSLLAKYFGDNQEVMTANAAQNASANAQVKNKSVTISGRTEVKRRITKLTMLSSNRIILLDELNSALLLVRLNGNVISELKGKKLMHVVGNGKDTVAVLGFGTSLQVTVYMAVGEHRLEEQICTKLEPTLSEVSGFSFDPDSREYSISGAGKVIILSDTGKTKKTMSYAKCLSGREVTGSLKTAYDFDNNSVYILNTLEKYLKRFDFGKEQIKWESKIENGQNMPREMYKGKRMVYVSYQDCIKSVAMDTGTISKTVKTGTVVSEVFGVFVGESTGMSVVSSAADSVEGSNKFGIVAV